MLQQVWSKTHGREKSFEIKVNTAPWQLVSNSCISTMYCLYDSFCQAIQKLCEYRARLGAKALGALSNFFVAEKGQASLGNSEAMKSFATRLLKKCRFVYKDGEVYFLFSYYEFLLLISTILA